MAWVSHHLANAYKCLHDFRNAYRLYTESLAIYERHYGVDHKECAQILRDFGNFYVLKKEYATAEVMLKKALVIFEKNKIPEAYTCHEYLGQLYRKKGQHDKAKMSYKAALAMVRANFSNDSAHTKRIIQELNF